MAILEAFKHKYCVSLGICDNILQFTDPNPKIYWYA